MAPRCSGKVERSASPPCTVEGPQRRRQGSTRPRRGEAAAWLAEVAEGSRGSGVGGPNPWRGPWPRREAFVPAEAAQHCRMGCTPGRYQWPRHSISTNSSPRVAPPVTPIPRTGSCVRSRAVSDPAAVLEGLGEPKRSEVQRLYHPASLTILNVVWAPRMTVTPRSPHVGGDRHLHRTRGQYLLAAGAGRPERKAGGGRGQGAGREGCRAARAQHHSFGHQSDRPPDRCHPRLRGRFLPRGAQRVGSRDAAKSATTSIGRCAGSRKPTPADES